LHGGVGQQQAEALLRSLPDPDARLAASMRKVPVVTRFILTDRSGNRRPAAKAGFAFAGDDPLGHLDSFPATIADLPILAAAAGDGSLNQSPEWDHVVRRVPLILRLGNTPYPSLAAEALRVAFGASTYVGRAAGGNGARDFGKATGLTAIRIGPLTVPTDAADRMWLHYTKPRPGRLISAADILAGDLDPNRIAGHIVLVGTSAAGVINDVQATPVAAEMPGVKIHAQLVDQILA
jgi:adenylate cyclase